MPQHVLRVEFLVKISVQDADKVVDFVFAGLDVLRASLIGDIRGSDQREIFHVGVDEDKPSVRGLEDVTVSTIPPALHDDVAALDQADALRGVLSGHAGQHRFDPGPAGVEDGSGRDTALQAGLVVAEDRVPELLLAASRYAFRTDEDACAPPCCVHSIQNDQPGVVNPHVPVCEPLAEFMPHGNPFRHRCKIERGCPWNAFSRAETVVEMQPKADQPAWPLFGAVHQNELQRPSQMRRNLEDYFPFAQGLPYKADLIVFQVPESAMDVLARAT